MFIIKDNEQTIKGILPSRFQEAIDEAAMRLGEIDSEAYLAGWNKGDWIKIEGDLAQLNQSIISKIENDFSDEKLKEILDSI